VGPNPQQKKKPPTKKKHKKTQKTPPPQIKKKHQPQKPNKKTKNENNPTQHKQPTKPKKNTKPTPPPKPPTTTNCLMLFNRRGPLRVGLSHFARYTSCSFFLRLFFIGTGDNGALTSVRSQGEGPSAVTGRTIS